MQEATNSGESNSPTKPQLHVSMLEQMSRCGIQFQRRYGARFGCWHEEEIIPPNIALATGSSVHRTVEANLRNKMESDGNPLPIGHIEELARDSVQGFVDQGLSLTNDEAIDIEKTVGATIDQTVALSKLHYLEVAPLITPAAVEERFVITLDGYPFDLSGQKDVRDTDGNLRDTKTAAKSPSANAARSLQMAMYSLSEKVERGKLPKAVYLDFLVKTKFPKVVIVEATPSEGWIDPLLRRVEQATKIIQSVKEGRGEFTPADAGHPWACTAKFCGYHATCPFYSGK